MLADGQEIQPPAPIPVISSPSGDSTSASRGTPANVNFPDTTLPVNLSLSVAEVYDDNIFISQTDRRADYITEITPNVVFVKGDPTAANSNYLKIEARPTFLFYAKNSGQNTIDQYEDGAYQYNFTRLTLGIEQRYEHLSTANIDIGNLAQRDIYTTLISSDYNYNDALSIKTSASQRITDYDATPGTTITDTTEWTINSYALYQITPKIALGVGPRIGFVDIQGAPNQTHEDLLFHANYDAGSKISFGLSAGIEDLQYEDQNNENHFLPIFRLSGVYQPFDGTMLTASGFRETLVSYSLFGQNYIDTSIQADFRQRFLNKYYFTLSAGYTDDAYQPGSTNVTGQLRQDDYFYGGAGVEWDPNDYLKFAARFKYSDNSSNFNDFSFTDNRITVQATFSY